MKKPIIMKLERFIRGDKAAPRPGFALVVTLVLMVLLAIIALGLLSLSSVALRSSSNENAMSVAKGNARLALILAIGELQKNAGPDQRITATGSIMANPGDTVERPNITGVWESWKIDPNALPASSEYEKDGGKESKFLRWLVSSPDPTDAEDQGYADVSPTGGDFVQLMPEIVNTTASYPALFGERVEVSEGSASSASGGFAYAVMDEGTKARIDTAFRNPSGSQVGDVGMSLGSGVRADISKIPEMADFPWAEADLDQNGAQLAKATSFDSGKLLYEEISGSTSSDVGNLQHDITVSSAGVFSDVVNGGLKKDLNSILNADDLPNSLDGLGVYESQLDYSVGFNAETGEAEPRWEAMRDFFTAYQTDVTTQGDVPSLQFAGTQGWSLDNSSVAPPRTDSAVIMPTVSKVQIFFSLIACPLKQGNDINNTSAPWVFGNNRTWGDSYNDGARYHLYLIYTPVITLHNPYNVALEVPELFVSFTNVPLSIQISRNAEPFYPSNPGAVGTLHQGTSNLGFSKAFGFRIGADDTPLKMQPGELVVFSPDIPESSNIQTERELPESSPDIKFLDRAGRGETGGGGITAGIDTANQTAARGVRGESVGYALDFVNQGSNGGNGTQAGEDTLRNNDSRRNGRDSFRLLAAGDTLRIKSRPTPDARRNGNTQSEPGIFSVVMSDGTNSVYSALNFDFPTTQDGSLITGLEDALGDTEEIIFPKSGTLTTADIALPSTTTPISEFPSEVFAVVTATTKTTLGARDGTNFEGRYATKPWSFTSPGGNFFNQHIEAGSPVDQSAFPYDLDVIGLDPGSGFGSDVYVTADGLGRGIGFTGQTTQVGKQFATFRDFPLAPLQAMPQLNAADLGSGNNASRFLNPVGNSWAHQMLTTGDVTSGAYREDVTAQFDHSFLLNSSLYDSFYFSGIAPRISAGSGLLTSVNTDELATNFITGERDLMTDSRLIPWVPAGTPTSDIIDLLSDESTASDQAASFQLMEGAFNVNSTSVDAWKAMLASAHAERARINAINLNSTSGDSTILDLDQADDDETRFSRFRLPNSEPADEASGGTDPVQSFFQGPRDITDDELDLLAEEIVEQVKTRGPFLSMAEFVNRRIGTSSDLTLKGALQAAIDETAINTDESSLAVLADTGYEITRDKVDSSIVTPDAALGRSDQGSPGNLTQADLLTVLGNAATVRSDTFRIRAYGEARDRSGNITAKVMCEAVVQRTPDFIDSTNESHLALDDPNLSAANIAFGRKFEVVSFRWLDDSEVQNGI